MIPLFFYISLLCITIIIECFAAAGPKKNRTEPKPIINLEFNRFKRIVLLPTYYYVHHTTTFPTIIPPLRRPLFMISVEIDYSWELFLRELNSDSRLDFLPFFDSFFSFSSLSGFSVTSCFLSDFLESSFLDLWWWWWDLEGFCSVTNFTSSYQHIHSVQILVFFFHSDFTWIEFWKV